MLAAEATAMGALGRILKLGWFVGLAGASVVVQACGGATSSRRSPGAGGADGGTGGTSAGAGGTAPVTGGVATGGTADGSGGATGGTSPLDAGPPSGGVLIEPPDAGVRDADLWDVIYE